MEKKVYLNPEMAVVEVKVEGVILVQSGGEGAPRPDSEKDF